MLPISPSDWPSVRETKYRPNNTFVSCWNIIWVEYHACLKPQTENLLREDREAFEAAPASIPPCDADHCLYQCRNISTDL